jgi:hypothetical protein
MDSKFELLKWTNFKWWLCKVMMQQLIAVDLNNIRDNS